MCQITVCSRVNGIWVIQCVVCGVLPNAVFTMPVVLEHMSHPMNEFELVEPGNLSDFHFVPLPQIPLSALENGLLDYP